jgi:5-methylcytosine-specific restriction protein A
MPARARRTCSYPGCSNLAEAGSSRCIAHSHYDNHKPERQRLYDRTWRARRAAYLASHPWCEDCLEKGLYVPAVDVHHVDRHEGDRVKFVTSPLRALCKECHSKHTAVEVGWARGKSMEGGGQKVLTNSR